MPASPENVTELLVNWGHGDAHAIEELTPLAYEELRRLAGRYLRRERLDHTLQSAALVHEAYLRLVDQRSVEWQNDHARGRRAAKRGAGEFKLSLDEAIDAPKKRDVDLVALDDALEGLAKIDPQHSRLVELRFFAGLGRPKCWGSPRRP